MKEALEKLGTYNLFNYLLPGCVFSVIAEHFKLLTIRQGETISDLFIFYFVGLVISRIGSLIVEPALKKVGVIKFGAYDDFVKASATDPKIEVLSEVNNMYRTLAAMFASLALLKLWTILSTRISLCDQTVQWCAIVGGTTLFIVSYRKQSAYVATRVSVASKKFDTHCWNAFETAELPRYLDVHICF
ncbi:MAG: hypothetical protein IAE77_11355 [Prosthecobacter sp.]|jgi:hypothetical protein|uniref:hypothetical protein n=1 Tax=Prosthecobacter sp. TaxID=1965333 RepID=UPI0019F4AC15|nr:hypothetical protein [Prosthecobacter sp.]MBE2284044.1 hypothetical protein [Prosthecobacter sp.]